MIKQTFTSSIHTKQSEVDVENNPEHLIISAVKKFSPVKSKFETHFKFVAGVKKHVFKHIPAKSVNNTELGQFLYHMFNASQFLPSFHPTY